ncbi:MAG: phosphatase [Suipraeoptans sp.]
MRIEIDTHTHTIESGHAYSSMKEMIIAAKKKGLKGIAITDHAPEMPGGPHEYYFTNLRVVPKEIEGVRVLCGVELNIMDEAGNVDLPETVLKALDLKIASIHTPCFMRDKEHEININTITNAYERVMENPNIDIIGHPDDSRLPIDYKRLVKLAVKTGTLLELNNSSLSPVSHREGAKENVEILLRLCKEEGAMIVVGTDAHIEQAVGNIDYALERLEAVDFPEELVANSNLEKFLALL